MVVKNGQKPPSNGTISEKLNPLQCIISLTPVLVRKSTRKTASKIARERQNNILSLLANTSEHEKCLKVEEFPGKGRGVRTGKSFAKDDFVCEYKGDIIDYKEAKQREKEYSYNPNIGSYMFFFYFKNQRWCIDATKESIYKGRLINHSFLRPNLRTELIEDNNGKFYLGLFALRNIAAGEELLYDYGDHSAETISGNPWILNT